MHLCSMRQRNRREELGFLLNRIFFPSSLEAAGKRFGVKSETLTEQQALGIEKIPTCGRLLLTLEIGLMGCADCIILLPNT